MSRPIRQRELPVRAYVANTDADWYRHLSRLAARPGGLDEANFWKPSGGQGFKALSFGEPLVFKLKKAHSHAVVGFGLFAAFRRLSVREAWDAFGEANGARSPGGCTSPRMSPCAFFAIVEWPISVRGRSNGFVASGDPRRANATVLR